MALRSRRQREQEQKRRMARGRRNLSQLAGPVAQGQRTPMNRGSGAVSTVQAPPFQQSNVSNDITQAGLAYKGGKGLFDFAMGKEAYTDAAGKAVPAKAPLSFGDQSILGEGGHVDEYFGKVGNRWNEATEGAKSLFDTPTPQPGRVQAAGGGIFGSTTPTSPASGSGIAQQAVPGSSSALQAAEYANSPALQTMNKFNLGGNITGLGTGLNPSNVANASSLVGGMSGVGTGATTGSNLLGASNSAFAGANAASNVANAATAANAASNAANAATAASKGAEAVSGLNSATGAASGASGVPWLSYANLAKDLVVGGPGAEKITGSVAGDAAIRAAGIYFTFGLSEIPYALF
jgi:hypothetical protein